ncbi:SAM-dependent methyltransferase [Streptomyces sp. NBC_01803]|uniref:SAM-dependent methyltransferase n=1 Tax=Streptomyces sp. NBC_01803 TaxID=2975946 RepID=UPI002DD9FEEB|nr:SAM-dependent methyltransferase [Streptomyces sp. NBC_01803]WSA43523.1 SAM-dependent methyltransferase [Streptomyces sp. NBC_01803]
MTVDANVAHNARVWDYWLGGRENYEVDRWVGDEIIGMFPGIVQVARADRLFLARAVAHLAGEAGVRQFLDIGTGLPTEDNTHEVAQRLAPDARVVYVDNDPLVLAHARALLVSRPEGATDYVEADAHDPDAILQAAAKTLDFGRPVAIMLLGLLNFILDTEEAEEVVRRLLDAVPAGSYVVLTHPTDELGGEANAEAIRHWNRQARPPLTTRTRAEISRFLRGLDLLDPGLVTCSRWRPGADGPRPAEVPQYGAVGRKP